MRMPNLSKHISLFLVLIALAFALLPAPVVAAPSARPPDLTAQAAILIDLDTGQVLFAKNTDQKYYPASTTKILTALIALEKANLSDVVTVSDRAIRAEGTRVYLAKGEQVTMEKLLYGLLLNSGNDAAIAIAEHIAGSVENFSLLMNQKAAELGALDSHFVTPNGLHDPQHYTTAADLARISRAAMQNPVFRKIAGTRTMPWHGAEWETVLVNHNKLLSNFEGATGVKNGYTDQAGYTLVASATRGEENFLAVLLKDSNRNYFDEAAALLEYGFDNFAASNLVNKGQVVARIEAPAGNPVKLIAGVGMHYLYDASMQVPLGTLRLNPLVGPIKSGTKVGELVYTLDDQSVGRVDVLLDGEIPGAPSGRSGWWSRLGWGLVVLFFVFRLDSFLRKRRRRRNRYMYSARSADRD